jgi:hypothetical protein
LEETKESEIPSSFTGVSPENIGVWREMIARWKKDENKNKSLENMFSEVKYSARAYAEFFGLDNKIGAWLDLQDEDISKLK